MPGKDIVDNMINGLIISNFGSYDDILEMSFEGAIRTFSVIYLNNLNQIYNHNLMMEKNK